MASVGRRASNPNSNIPECPAKNKDLWLMVLIKALGVPVGNNLSTVKSSAVEMGESHTKMMTNTMLLTA